MVPRKETALRKDTAINNGISAQQDASDDNAHADTRNKDNSPEAMRRDGNSEEETTSAVENEEQCHKGTFPTATRRGPNKGN